MTKVCRLCLASLQRGSKYFNVNAVESYTGFMPYRDQLTTLIPEMALDLIPNPVICNNCRHFLKSAYEFKTRCLRVEERIRKFVEADPEAQDLSVLAIKDAKSAAELVVECSTPEMDKHDDYVDIKREQITENVVREFVVFKPTSSVEDSPQLEEKFECLVKGCRLFFDSSEKLMTHKLQHSVEAPEDSYICNFCNLSFKTLQTLRKHNSRCKTAAVPTKSPLNILTKRPHLPTKAKNHLKKWLFKHTDHPYPTDQEKQQLMKETNLTLLQVENWFINARRRILQDLTTLKRKRSLMGYDELFDLHTELDIEELPVKADDEMVFVKSEEIEDQ